MPPASTQVTFNRYTADEQHLCDPSVVTEMPFWRNFRKSANMPAPATDPHHTNTYYAGLDKSEQDED